MKMYIYPFVQGFFALVIYPYTAALDVCFCYVTSYTWAGTKSTTETGRTCQRWDSQSPHSHTRNNPSSFPDASLSEAANYCRDPDRGGIPWCYTTDGNKRWENCGVPKCGANDCTTTATPTTTSSTTTSTTSTTTTSTSTTTSTTTTSPSTTLTTTSTTTTPTTTSTATTPTTTSISTTPTTTSTTTTLTTTSASTTPTTTSTTITTPTTTTSTTSATSTTTTPTTNLITTTATTAIPTTVSTTVTPIAPSSSRTPLYIRPCLSCSKSTTESALTEATLKEFEIDPKTTSLSNRSKISVQDSRPSATIMGYTGLVVICSVLTFLCSSDLIAVSRFCIRYLTCRR